MTVTPYVIKRTESYVEGAFIESMKAVLLDSEARFVPDELLTTTNGKPVFPVNDSGEIILPIYGGYPETPTHIPSVIVTANKNKTQFAGLMAEDYHTSEDSRHDTFVKYYTETGVVTITLNARTYEQLQRLKALVEVWVYHKFFLVKLTEFNVTITSNYIVWSNPSLRSYSNLKYYLSSANIDFRVESVVGTSHEDEFVEIEEVQSNSEIIED